MSNLKDRETAQQVAPPALEDWQELLLNAAAHMEEHGKCEGMMEDDQGRVCFLGAIHRSTPYTPIAVSIAQGKIRSIAYRAGLSVGQWSDCNTQQFVVATMRRVACSG